MEEFDIDLTNDIGTPIVQLKNKSNNDLDNNFNYEDETCNSEMIMHDFNYDNNRNDLINKMSRTIDNNTIRNVETSQSKKQNINNFVRNLEINLDNLNQPTPEKLTTEKINTNVEQNTKINTEIIEKTLINKICKFEYMDILICMLLFILLNNKLVIQSIYDISLLDNINGPYLNLFIRALIFGLILFLTKKFNI
jgi:hypothetical protein